jgi:hypothetical protein
VSGIYRCEDGHLFQRGWKQTIFEANRGPGRHYGTCPVDGKRTLYTRVSEKDLTEDQIAQARAYR